MALYYRLYQNEEGRSNTGHPCFIAPELTEFETPSGREDRTACALWCNIMEDHLDFFRRCEQESIHVTMIVYSGNINERLRKVYSIGNIPACHGAFKIIPLSDIDY